MLHFLPERAVLGLPGLGNDLRLENVRYADLFTRVGGQRLFSLDALAVAAGDRNDVENALAVETLGVAVRGKRLAFGAYHRFRGRGQAEYRGDLVDLAAYGNAPFIGATVELAPRGTVVSYHEVGAGLSYALSDRVAVGARLKYLAGATAVQTSETGSLRLTTGEETYDLRLEQDIVLRTVGALRYPGNLSGIRLDYYPYRLDPADLGSGNAGVGLDLGVAVNLDRVRLNASVTDLAAGINWKREVTTLTFRGDDRFSGVDVLGDLLRGDSVSLATALDSLVDRFNPEVDAAGFRTSLSPTLYLGGEYDLSGRFTAGALLVLEQRLGEAKPAGALLGRYRLTDWLQLGVNVSYRADLQPQAGMHLYATPGRFRLLVASDKLFTLIGSDSPVLAGLRIGASLALGPLPDRSSASFRRESR